MKGRRPCLTCGRPCSASRCPTCARAHEKGRRPSFAARGYTAEYRRNRKIILADHPVCAICGKVPATTTDHIIPRARGGGNDLDNLRPACLSCNSGRGARP